MIALSELDSPALDPQAHLELVDALVEQGWYVGKVWAHPLRRECVGAALQQRFVLGRAEERVGRQHHRVKRSARWRSCRVTTRVWQVVRSLFEYRGARCATGQRLEKISLQDLCARAI